MVLGGLDVSDQAGLSRRQRIVDELPQSGAGRMIMTTQPRFIPDEAALISLDENTRLRRDMLGLRERQFELERRCDGQQRELCALRAQLDEAESPAGTAQSE